MIHRMSNRRGLNAAKETHIENVAVVESLSLTIHVYMHLHVHVCTCTLYVYNVHVHVHVHAYNVHGAHRPDLNLRLGGRRSLQFGSQSSPLLGQLAYLMLPAQMTPR